MIDIVVKNHSDYNKTTAVSPSGTISLLDVGEIKAAGLTKKTLEANIQAELEKTLNNVFVSVTEEKFTRPG